MQLKTFCPFPVGYVYMSADGTSPGTLFPNTSWEQIQGKFLFASDATRSAGDTGGAEDVTLTTDQIPSHSHSVGAHAHGLNSHTHSVGAHAHGLNSHTHTYAKPNTVTGGTAITVAQMPSHNHNSKTLTGSFRIADNVVVNQSGADEVTEASGICSVSNQTNNECYMKTSTGVANVSHKCAVTITATHTHDSQGSGSTHTHTIGATSTNTGGPSTTNTANSAAFNSGGPSTANTANSAAFDSSAAGGGRLTATCRRTSRSTCGRGSRRARRRSALPSGEVA